MPSDKAALKQMALELVEFYTCGDFQLTEELATKLYRLSHAALETCCKHTDWEAEIVETYEDIIQPQKEFEVLNLIEKRKCHLTT